MGRSKQKVKKGKESTGDLASETDAHADARGYLVFTLAVVLDCHRQNFFLTDLIYVPLAVKALDCSFSCMSTLHVSM